MLTQCQLIFKVHALTQPDETVKIVGNSKELGSWNIEQAFVLSTDTTRYPEWSNEIALTVPKGTKLEFKLVIVKGNQFQWENLPQNRKYRSRYCRVVLKAQWNNCEGGVVVEKKFKSSVSLNPATLQNYKKQKHSTEFNPYEQGSSDSDDGDSFSMNDLPPLRSDDEDNFSIGDLPMSKSKKITHNVENSIIEEDDDIKGSSHSFLVPKYDAKNIHSQDSLGNRSKQGTLSKRSLSKNDSVNSMQQDLSSADMLIICTFYLPVKIIYSKDENSFTHEIDHVSISSQIMQACSGLPCKSILIGIPLIYDTQNNPICNLTEELQNDCKIYLNQKLNYEPIFVALPELNKFNQEFYHDYYEPVMIGKSRVEDGTSRECQFYFQINQSFSTKLEYTITRHTLNQNCLMMIVDDRLLLIPAYLYKTQIVPVSLFLYNKFPTRDQIQGLTFHKELMTSILLCNQILFQNYETASNLLDYFTASPDMNVRSQRGSLIVKYLDKEIQIKIKSTGIALDVVEQKLVDGFEVEKIKTITDKHIMKKNQTKIWLEETLLDLKSNSANMIFSNSSKRIVQNQPSESSNVMESDF